jgi:hypothetical protein
MKEDLSALRAEVVVLQRTEEILKSRHKNLDDFLDKLAAENGVAVSGLSHVFVLLPQDIAVANVDFYVGASPAYHGTPRIYV